MNCSGNCGPWFCQSLFYKLDQHTSQHGSAYVTAWISIRHSMDQHTSQHGSAWSTSCSTLKLCTLDYETCIMFDSDKTRCTVLLLLFLRFGIAIRFCSLSRFCNIGIRKTLSQCYQIHFSVKWAGLHRIGNNMLWRTWYFKFHCSNVYWPAWWQNILHLVAVFHCFVLFIGCQ